MGKSYRDMHRINELAQELHKELERFEIYLQGEVEYMGRGMIAQEVADAMAEYGESDSGAIDISDDIRESISDDIDEWIQSEHPEFETIKIILPLLKALY